MFLTRCLKDVNTHPFGATIFVRFLARNAEVSGTDFASILVDLPLLKYHVSFAVYDLTCGVWVGKDNMCFYAEELNVR